MAINLIIRSKNKKSLFYFLHVINKFNRNKKIKIISKLSKTKRFTILKSPHVNKTAQEQFESNWFSISIEIDSIDISKLLVIMKHVQNRFCYDIYIKILFKITNKSIQNDFFSFKNKILFQDKKFDLKQLILNLNYYGTSTITSK